MPWRGLNILICVRLGYGGVREHVTAEHLKGGQNTLYRGK